jgi:hypothetical protein
MKQLLIDVLPSLITAFASLVAVLIGIMVREKLEADAITKSILAEL